jgi:hypothetical protein
MSSSECPGLGHQWIRHLAGQEAFEGLSNQGREQKRNAESTVATTTRADLEIARGYIYYGFRKDR